jgi:hypothetical protein
VTIVSFVIVVESRQPYRTPQIARIAHSSSWWQRAGKTTEEAAAQRERRGYAGTTPAFFITLSVVSSASRAPSSGVIVGGTRPSGSGLTAST